MSYRGSHRMPLGRRIRLWVYTFPLGDGLRILAVGAVVFVGTLVVLGLLSGCKNQGKHGHLFCTGHPTVCVHES